MRLRLRPASEARSFLLLGLAAALLAAGCMPRRRLPPTAFARESVQVACCGHADEPLELVYLGVGGWLLRKGDAAVLTAPLFSNPGLFEAGMGHIQADPDRIEQNLPEVEDVSAILVGHGHYDHLMDVPYIAQARAPRAVIYGNETVARQLVPFGLAPGRVRTIEDAEKGDVARPGRWIEVGEGVRIMPLVSDHAPHFAGILLYSGVRTREMSSPPRSANDWLAGETIAFLIDFLNADGSVGLRVYYQDAVPAPPYGLVPALDDGVGVDVAVVVPATYAEVSWHPEALLENTRPRHVLLGHWEDFFEAPSRPPEPVPFTLLPDFVARLERALPEGSGWDLPVPGTRFWFN